MSIDVDGDSVESPFGQLRLTVTEYTQASLRPTLETQPAEPLSLSNHE